MITLALSAANCRGQHHYNCKNSFSHCCFSSSCSASRKHFSSNEKVSCHSCTPKSIAKGSNPYTNKQLTGYELQLCALGFFELAIL